MLSNSILQGVYYLCSSFFVNRFKLSFSSKVFQIACILVIYQPFLGGVFTNESAVLSPCGGSVSLFTIITVQTTPEQLLWAASDNGGKVITRVVVGSLSAFLVSVSKP